MKQFSLTNDCANVSKAGFFAILFFFSPNIFAQNVSVTGALTGSYTNLRFAFNAINAGGGSGAVTVTINVDHTITTTKCTLNQTNYTVSIVPNGARKVDCNLNDDLILLNGADNVTIDGLNTGGNSLTLANSNTGAGGAVITLNSSANNNQVKNLTLRGAQTPTFSIGVVNIKGNSDNNKVQNCKITGQTSTGFIRNGIVLQGSNTTSTNDNTEISGCEISNFYSSGAFGEGIFSWQYNRGTLITGNHFFQENTIINNSTGTVWRGMEIQDGLTDPAATVTITNNFIGGTAPNCGGGPWHTGNSGLLNFVSGIYVYSGSNAGAGASIQGNTVQNFNLPNSYSASGGVIPFAGIYVQGGRANIGTTTGNTIGSGTGTGSISGSCLLTVNSTVNFAGIATESASPVSIANNTVGSFTISRSGSLGVVRFLGIYSGSSDANTITNNLIGSQTEANSIQTNGGSAQLSLIGIDVNNSSSTVTGNTVKNMTNGAAWEVSGILSWHEVSGKTFTCTNNTVANLQAASGLDNDVTGIFVYCPANSIVYTVQITGNTLTNLSVYASTGSELVGIGLGQSNTTIQAIGNVSNNTLTNFTNYGTDENAFCAGITGYTQFGGNLTIANNSISNFDSKMVDTYGIRIVDDKSPSSGIVTISQNTIFDIECQRVSGPNFPTGILVLGKNIAISRNKIYGLRTQFGTAGSEVRGIQTLGDPQSNYSVNNNFVSLAYDNPVATDVYGITSNTGAAINDLDIYYNTVFIGGTGTGTSACFDRRTTSNVSGTIRNNIFYNARPSGLAISNTATPPESGWTSGASNKNYFVSPTAGSLAKWGTTTHDMAGWRTASGGDAGTVTRVIGPAGNETLPEEFFVNHTTGDLSLLTDNANECAIVQNIGEAVAGITIDFFGNARTATPDLGGFEFASVLPLEWVGFQAVALENANQLLWKTASESGVSHFEIERSADGFSFEKIGEAAAAGGFFEKSYTFDDRFFSEKNWYRIRSVDFDGKSGFTPVAFVSREGFGQNAMAIYPNPTADGAVSLRYFSEKEGDVLLEIIAASGQVLRSEKVFFEKGENRLPLDLSGLPKGVFVLKTGGLAVRFVRL